MRLDRCRSCSTQIRPNPENREKYWETSRLGTANVLNAKLHHAHSAVLVPISNLAANRDFSAPNREMFLGLLATQTEICFSGGTLLLALECEAPGLCRKVNSKPDA